MTLDEIRLVDASPKAIMEAVEAGWLTRSTGGITIRELVEYSKKSTTTAERALIAGVQLGMMTDNGLRFVTKDDLSVIGNATKSDWPVIFGKFLPHYKPFIMFVTLISKGADAEEAARKVTVIYRLSIIPSTTEKVLKSWGQYAGVLKPLKNGKLKIKINADQLDVKTIHELLDAMENDIQAGIYLSNMLGADLYAFIPNDDLNLLVQAIRNYESNPRGSINNAMKVLESFLRILANKEGVDTSSCNGIGQLVSTIRNSKLITKVQTNIGVGLGTIRNLSEHVLDKDTNKRWDIHPDSAIESILLSLSYIRSVYNFIIEKRQTF